jgi:hypothetical protein
MFLNTGLPAPRMTGVKKIRYSSLKPSRMKVDARSALPNKFIYMDGAFLHDQPGLKVTLLRESGFPFFTCSLKY